MQLKVLIINAHIAFLQSVIRLSYIFQSGKNIYKNIILTKEG